MLQKSPKDTRKILQLLPVRTIIAGLDRIQRKCDPYTYGFYNLYGLEKLTPEALAKQQRNKKIILRWSTSKLSYGQLGKEYNLNRWTIRSIIKTWWWYAVFHPATKYGGKYEEIPDIDIIKE